ncbi:MAG: DUF1800 domain-containing protein [Lautropia sp.]|nr:DUF1800 domain-containing protein [Lautropia sp.]
MRSDNRLPRTRRLPAKAVLATAIGLMLTACGGSEQVEEMARTWQQIQAQYQQANESGAWGQTGTPGALPAPAPQKLQTWTLATEAEVSRFLSQASYGPTRKDLKTLKGKTANDWIEREFNKPQTLLLDTMDSWSRQDGKASNYLDFHNSWWFSTVQEDQLRQRMAFALSQIFVISSNGSPGQYPRGMAHYYDMLAKNAFGNFRQLLEEVTRHPMMGLYLTHIRNHKEQYTRQGILSRAPDENFAREVMQLFTIGLEELNLDGTPKLDGRGHPIPTYTNQDIQGLARVFTGWSWHAPKPSFACFYGTDPECNQATNPNRDVRLMMPYPNFHSIEAKKFLTAHIDAGIAQPERSLKIALDTLFNHPNVGPFIGKQLIQRLVTSNPSPAYVQRVATAFNNNGNGVRGDMKAVIRAVLLDPDARSAETARNLKAGRIREPVLRITHWLRAFDTSSISKRWRIGLTDTPGSPLHQTAMRSPSVFNFFRPGYSPSNTPAGHANMLAPEMQLVNESSIAGYASFMGGLTGGYWATVIGGGPVMTVPDPKNPKSTIKIRDIQPDYRTELALAAKPAELVKHLDDLLMNGQMQADTRQNLITAIQAIEYPRNPTADQRDYINRTRVGIAIYLAMMSTDYLVLK